MSGYGIPYTVAVDGGDLFVATVALDGTTVPDGYTAVVAKGGPVMLVPTVALVAVDTTPEEPEPGAWLIGDVMCARVGNASGGAWATHIDKTSPNWWLTWATVWAKVGGPGITPRRLVPEPAVDLPAAVKSHDQNTVIVDHYEAGTVSMTLPRRLTEWFDADGAEILGNAFLAAARAAREATP